MSDSGSDMELHAEAAAAKVGTLLQGRYRLQEVIGSGGVGVVYRALDMDNADGQAGPATVAIKLLHEQFGLTGPSRSRFEREGKALQRLSHPNIVELRGYGVSDGAPFLVMELLRGNTLHRELRDGAMPMERAVAVAREILAALDFAHGLGVVHRDLKPGNIFVAEGSDGPVVKILDFGLAKFLTAETSGAGQTLTRSGMVLGTPQYMPPEQGTGDRVDARADLYAVGCVFYEMLAGRPPFERDSQVELIRAHLLDPPPPLPRKPALAAQRAELDVILARAMAKDPVERYASAAEMVAAMDSVGTGKLTQARRGRRGLMWLLGAMALWLVVGLWWAQHDEGLSRETDVGAGATRDPFEVHGTPPELAGVAEHVFAGKTMTTDEVGDVQAFIRLHPEDPRPLLLLGHGFCNQHWFRDAIDRYGRAVAVDPAAVHDPRMLGGLLKIVTESPKYQARAGEFIVEHHGRLARDGVRAALAAAGERGPAAGRLRALLKRLP